MMWLRLGHLIQHFLPAISAVSRIRFVSGHWVLHVLIILIHASFPSPFFHENPAFRLRQIPFKKNQQTSSMITKSLLVYTCDLYHSLYKLMVKLRCNPAAMKVSSVSDDGFTVQPFSTGILCYQHQELNLYPSSSLTHSLTSHPLFISTTHGTQKAQQISPSLRDNR